MALIDPSKSVRVEIPHEPGEWAQLRPMTAADVAELQRSFGDESNAGWTLHALGRCLEAWSYDAVITEETLGRLDYVTFGWLSGQLLETSGMRSEEEKKDSGRQSSATTAPDGGSSPESSAT